MRVFDFDGTIYDGESLFDLYLFSVRYEPRVLRYIAPVLNCGIRYKMGRAELGQMERKLDAVVRRYLLDLAASKRLGRAQRRFHEGKARIPYHDANPIPGSGAPTGAGTHGGVTPNIGPAGGATPALAAMTGAGGMGNMAGEGLGGLSREGLDVLSTLFWDRKFRKIKSWYVPRPDDVIITASFDLTVGEACRRLGVEHVIASTIDPETLEISYLNFSSNKVRRFREIYGEDAVIDEFYTDSRHDQPMIDIARTAYLVRGDKVIRIK